MRTVSSSIVAVLMVSLPSPVRAQLAPATEAQVAAIAESVLHETGVPSASVGILADGKIYTHAFGVARIAPQLTAAPVMAYPIGSISKQFTATAVLLLQQQGKLSIDDTVAKYFPELTRASEITLRNLLTMTSGYRDFAPEDYSIPAWYVARNPLETVKEWASKPLDFEPGTKWQYSNTNFVLLGLIVEKVSGEPFDKFLREHVFGPAHLNGVFNAYMEREKLQTTGYISYALGPPRVLPLEAAGWYFAAGELAMPTGTLLEWDRTFIDESVLSGASYRQMETPFVTKDGANTGYGFGIEARIDNGHLRLEHSGEVGGYVAENIVYPKDRVAIVVLTNEVASSAAGEIGAAVSALLLPGATPANSAPDTVAAPLSGILAGLARGEIDRELFTPSCNAYFSVQALKDFAATLAPLGAVRSLYRTKTESRGGMRYFAYRVVFSTGVTLIMNTYTMPDGKFDQLLITGRE